VIYLMHEEPGTHGVHDAPTVTRRKRYARRSSANASDFYQAQNASMQLSYVFTLTVMEEYDEERQLEYNGRMYDIVRIYYNRNGGIELTVQRSVADAD